MVVDGEEREQLQGHPDYWVSNTGHVYRYEFKDWRMLTPIMSSNYYAVKLDGKNYYIHRLVGEQFVKPDRADQTIIFHIDGDHFNNDASNLIWLNNSEVQKLARVMPRLRMQYYKENLT